MNLEEILALRLFGSFTVKEIEPHLEEDLGVFLEKANPLKVRKFKERYDEEVLKRQDELLKKTKAKVITYWDEDYPPLLREIPDPPVLLFALGNESVLKERSLAVVGTRKASGYGLSVTKRFVKVLSKYFVIISGMAFGIDSCAHNTVLEVGGRTVAILGNGVDIIYPSSNIKLYEGIIKNGCVVSEYPLGTKPAKFRFPERNRLIAGMSIGTLVVEAGRQSGALITARYSADYGRDVFAVPGDVDVERSEGTNWLIKMGAYPVTSPSDILGMYGISEGRENGEKDILVSLIKKGINTPDEMAQRLNVSVEQVLVELTRLELEGVVERYGGAYRLI
ncbi:MAG: DNA-protecting protein DprA [Thermotogae bacterium]|nr:MAG: DNA-protecting protein DprA [Thermotogota bacterium]